MRFCGAGHLSFAFLGAASVVAVESKLMGIGAKEKDRSDVVVDASDMLVNKSARGEITMREEIGTKETFDSTESVAVFVLKTAVLGSKVWSVEEFVNSQWGLMISYSKSLRLL